MADSGSEKVNKKPLRIKKDVAVMVVVLLIIAVYIIWQCFNATHIDVKTVTAVNSTVYQTIDTTALVIRDEHIINNDAASVTVACVEDGGKVKAGGNIAMEFSSAEAAQSYSRLTDLQEQLDYYIDLESKSAGTATDVASIDKDIVNDVNEYIRQAQSFTAGSLDSSSLNLNDKLTRRQIIIGEEIDFSSVKAQLQEEINSINSGSCSPTGYVKTDESGIFSSYTDGCESLFDYDGVKSINTETFDSYMNSVTSAKKNDGLGKLITNYEWYFCCKVTAEDIKNIEDGDVLDVALKDSDEVIKCTVESGATVDLGVKESVLVLRCSQMNGAISSMRTENIEIRYNEFKGFKLPSSAIHINEDGEKVVYALIANQVCERQGKIIYSTKDYAVFAYDPEDSGGMRLYDQIIIQGKDLYDGKVYT